MLKLILLLTGISLMIIGLFTAFLPIPGGVLPGLLGLVILISISPKTQQALCWVRYRYPWLDKGFHYVEDKLNHRVPALAKILEKTRPQQDNRID